MHQWIKTSSKNSPKPLFPLVWWWCKSRILLQHLEWRSNQMPERLYKNNSIFHCSPSRRRRFQTPHLHFKAPRRLAKWQWSTPKMNKQSQRTCALCRFCTTWLNFSMNYCYCLCTTQREHMLVCTAASCYSSALCPVSLVRVRHSRGVCLSLKSKTPAFFSATPELPAFKFISDQQTLRKWSHVVWIDVLLMQSFLSRPA